MSYSRPVIAPGHAMASPFPRGLVILAGNSYPQLAEEVSRYVPRRLNAKKPVPTMYVVIHNIH